MQAKDFHALNYQAYSVAGDHIEHLPIPGSHSREEHTCLQVLLLPHEILVPLVSHRIYMKKFLKRNNY